MLMRAETVTRSFEHITSVSELHREGAPVRHVAPRAGTPRSHGISLQAGRALRAARRDGRTLRYSSLSDENFTRTKELQAADQRPAAKGQER